MKIHCAFVSCFFLGVVTLTNAFTTTARRQPRRRRGVVVRHQAASANDDNDDDNYNNLNDLRQLLESSWNTPAMGQVPSTPELAARAAATAVQNALSRNILSMVDILLPQYDVNQSDKVYDQVLAVEFCIALAKELQPNDSANNNKKTCIVVRNNATIQVASRILDRREQSAAADAAAVAAAALEEEEEDDDDEEQEVDLFGDNSDAPKDDVDAFRAKLAAEWGKESSTASEETIPKPKSKRSSAEKPLSVSQSTEKSFIPPRQYRLCSMLGDAIAMPKGPDMQRAVVDAVRANALPRDDEGTLIILSASTPQELVGIRALAGQYQSSRKIVLVNCRATPLPRELATAQTVYSILPLVAKPTQSTSPFGSNDKNKNYQPPPKVVILRRFPRDWEIFVDTGHGFDLAATAPAESVPQKGPSMTWIANAVKRYLEARTR